MRPQKLERRAPKTGPIVQDNRKREIPKPDLSAANQPVRTIHLVEVGDMTTPQVQVMMNKLAGEHSVNTDGINFVLPVRHGKINSDVYFEQEWEALVRKLCEVREDGVIYLKGGAKETLVIRQNV